MNEQLDKTGLIELISEEAGCDPTDIADNTILISSGLLDSFALVTILAFVEGETGTVFEPESLTLENFDTVSAIMDLAQRAPA